MKTKKIVAMTLVLSTMLGMTGCGKNGDNAGNDTGKNTPAPEGSESVPAPPGDEAHGSDETGEERQRGGELAFATNQRFNSMFNPIENGNAVDWGWPCLEPLGTKRPGATEWDLLLAEDFTIDEENFVCTIKLKEGVTFHDGDSFDADDVICTYEVYLENGRDSILGYPTAINKIDDYTVEVTYDSFSLSYADWLLPVFMYSKQTYDEIGGEAMKTSMNGTGPFRMTEFIPDVSITYERYEDYWNAEEYNYGPDTITYLYIAEETTQIASFLAGDLSYFRTSSPETVEQLRGYGYEPEAEPNGTEFITYAQILTKDKSDPISEKAVRQAIYLYGVDWEAVTQTLYGELAFHTDGIGASTCGFYNYFEERSAVDYEKAKELLAEAGYPDGFETTIYTSAPLAAPATILQSELKKIGVEASVETLDQSALQGLGTQEPGVSGIQIGSLGFGSLQMDRFRKFFSYTGALANGVEWSDEEKALFDACNAAMTQNEEDQATAAYVTQYVYEDSQFWPISNVSNFWVKNENLVMEEGVHRGFGWDPYKIWIRQ